MQAKVLLIGESPQGYSHLVSRLEGQGFKSRFATTYQEAISRLNLHGFDMVFSPMRIRDRSVFPLISLLESSRTTLFYFQTVEKGCWWLPALRFGRNCFGSYALRPSEFIISLGQIMSEIQVLAEYQPPVAPSPPSLVVPLQWANTIPGAATPMRAKHSQLLMRKAAG